jgi:beta-lactamase regulating signal transducer with metallopeptidase domain
MAVPGESVPSPQTGASPVKAAIVPGPRELLGKIASYLPYSSDALALAFWLGTASLWWCLTASRLARFGRLLQSAEHASAELQEQADTLALRLGIKRAPQLWLVPAAIPPMLWGLGPRSKLLLPAGLSDRLTADGRAAILVHELAHLKRRDHWIRLLEFVVTGLYWWNPLVWWSRRGLRDAEEQCCDGWVVWALPASARSYASSILDTVDYLAEAPTFEPVVGTALTSAGHLKRRLLKILGGMTSKDLSWPAAVTLLGLICVPEPRLSDRARPAYQRGERRSERAGWGQG